MTKKCEHDILGLIAMIQMFAEAYPAMQEDANELQAWLASLEKKSRQVRKVIDEEKREAA